MENKRFEHIITRYLKGKATPEEEAELLQAIHASKEWEAAFRKRTAEWNPLEETEADPETDRKWNRIASIITPSESQSQTEEAPVISLVSTSSRRIWFSIAAVVLLLLVSGVTVYFLNQGGKAGTGNAEWQTIIAAQEDRSILLPDGSSVYLREKTDGWLIYAAAWLGVKAVRVLLRTSCSRSIRLALAVLQVNTAPNSRGRYPPAARMGASAAVIKKAVATTSTREMMEIMI